MKPNIARAIVAAQREASFTPSSLMQSTRNIQPDTASLQEIEDALDDCRFYWATAYPETENDLVTRIEKECWAAIERRYARHGTTIMKTIRGRCSGKDTRGTHR